MAQEMMDSDSSLEVNRSPDWDGAFQRVSGDLDDLLQRVGEGLPFTCSMYNSILMHASHAVDKSDFYVLRSKPDNSVVMWTPKDRRSNCVGLHCLERDVHLLKEGLCSTKLLNWTDVILFFHLPYYLVRPVEEVAQDMVVGHLHRGSSSVFILDKKKQLDIPLRCPRGFKVNRLGRKGIEVMLNSWRYSHYTTVQEFYEFTRTIPCVGVYEDPNREDYEVTVPDMPTAEDWEVPVAWASTTYCGAMDIVDGQRQHWRSGLVSLAAQVCGRMLVDMHCIAHACVEDRDTMMKVVFEGMQGWYLSHGTTWEWSCTQTHFPPL